MFTEPRRVTADDVLELMGFQDLPEERWTHEAELRELIRSAVVYGVEMGRSGYGHRARLAAYEGHLLRDCKQLVMSYLAPRDPEEPAYFDRRLNRVEKDLVLEVIREQFEAQDKASREAEERRQKTSVVYFIGGDEGPIKIGFSARPANRLAGLQTSHHQKLRIMAQREGGIELEREYHQRFSAHRLEGEWFARSPEILEEISRLGKARGEVSAPDIQRGG